MATYMNGFKVWLKFMGFHVDKYTNPMEHIGSREEISYGFNH